MKPRRERFALADLMIVVAASAIGVALLRTTIDSSGGGYLRHVPAPSSHWQGTISYVIPFRFFFVLYNGVPQILVASLCVVALSLRARRAAFFQLSQNPGLVLSLVAVTASAWTILVNFPALHWDDSGLAPWRLVVDHILPNAGFMALGSLMTLTIIGYGRPAPSWVDRMGYALGAILGSLLVLDHIRLLLENFRLM